MGDHYVINSPGEGEIVEKKSRFIGHAMAISSPEEASVVIEQIKRKYWDARHNCYAYVTGELGEISRCSDDGEPSGTAGKPILDVISGAGLRGALVVVTRYFGGTLLGTGGLVRAYTAAAREALDHAVIKHMVPAGVIQVRCDYSLLGMIKNYCESENISMGDVNYTEAVELSLTVEEDRIDSLMAKITDLTGGRAGVTLVSKGFFPL